jgi:catechol 2,3-dioxygenase-like lactoylglutathione lyase family enzyme
MIAHVSIGVTDVEKSKRFYDAALEPLGYSGVRAARVLVGYGYGAHRIALWVVAAERPVPAEDKSGLHICFAAPSAAADASGRLTPRLGAARFAIAATTSRRYAASPACPRAGRSPAAAAAGCERPRRSAPRLPPRF